MIADNEMPYERPAYKTFNPNQTTQYTFPNQSMNLTVLEKIAPFRRSFISPSVLLEPEDIIYIAKSSDSSLFNGAAFKQTINPISSFNSFYGKENGPATTVDQDHFVEYMEKLGWKYHRWVGKQLLISMVEI